MRLAALLVLAGALSACAGGQRPRISEQRIDRALASVAPEAQPTRVVVADLAYARDARTDGQWTAGLRYAAPGALLHGRNGPVSFQQVFGDRRDPAEANAWSPRRVIMSCDASLAVSTGRFRDTDAMVGDYVTIWARQADGAYRWIYDVAGRDDPQPPPQPAPAADEILVTAWDAVQGIVADCPRAGAAIPAPPVISAPADAAQQGLAQSADGTFRWRWAHLGDGTKRVVVDYFTQGEWREAVAEDFASDPAPPLVPPPLSQPSGPPSQ